MTPAHPRRGLGRDPGLPAGGALLGVCFTFLYNYFACLLRSAASPAAPAGLWLCPPGSTSGWYFSVRPGTGLGVAGAAGATVLAQGVSAAAGIALYGWRRVPLLRLERRHWKVSRGSWGDHELLPPTRAQQSVMNFGILMVQGLVNSFGGET